MRQPRAGAALRHAVRPGAEAYRTAFLGRILASILTRSVRVPTPVLGATEQGGIP